MSRLSQVLDPTLREKVDPADLSVQTGISLERLNQLLENAAAPSIWELGEIAEAISVNPSYLVRTRPAVVALRDSGVHNPALNALLEQFDFHVEAYSAELAQPKVDEAFPAKGTRGARASGTGWSSRHGVSTFHWTSSDSVLDVVERVHRIPVLFWPLPDAPFGATLRLYDTLAIWVNSYDVPATQQRFTLAHELGHIMLRHADDSRVEPASTPEMAASTGDPDQREREEHANAFAAGVLYNYDSIAGLWDGEIRPESVAHVAAGLGISFEAALVGMKTHLGPKVSGIGAAARELKPYEAFRSAGHGDYVDWYFSLTNVRRVPDILRYPELLEQALDRVTAR